MEQRKKSGFSLIELLVVITIIAILAALLTPQLIKAIERANRTQCLGNIKAIGQSMHIFANEHNEIYPVAADPAGKPEQKVEQSFGILYHPKFFTDMQVFVCPNRKVLIPDPPKAGITPTALVVTGKGTGKQEISYAIVLSVDSQGVVRRPYTNDNGQNVLLMEDPFPGGENAFFDNGDAHGNEGCNVYLINGQAKWWNVPLTGSATTGSGAITTVPLGPPISSGGGQTLPVNFNDSLKPFMIVRDTYLDCQSSGGS